VLGGGAGQGAGLLPGDAEFSVSGDARVAGSLAGSGVEDQRLRGEAGLPAVCVGQLTGQTRDTQSK